MLGVGAKPQVRSEMPATSDLAESILAAWRTNHQVTVFLVSHVPAAVWAARVPGAPRKTIRILAGHLHNSRVHVAQDPGPAPWHPGSVRRGPPEREPSSVGRRTEQEWPEHRSALAAGVSPRRQGSRQPGLRVAESAAGRRSRADLLRGPRGPSPG